MPSPVSNGVRPDPGTSRRKIVLIACGAGLMLVVVAVILATGVFSPNGPPATLDTPSPPASQPSGIATKSATHPTAAAAAYPPAGILAEKSGTITPAGGVIGIPDGPSVVFPPGAVERDTTIALRKLDPACFGPRSNERMVLLDCSAPVKQFAKPVEVRIPLAPVDDPGDAEKFQASLYDPASRSFRTYPAEVRTVDGKSELVLTTPHFCWFIFEWLLGDRPPAAAGPIEVPIYKQGQTLYCWAVDLQTLMRACGALPVGAPEIMGRTGIRAENSPPSELASNAGIEDIVREKTGAYMRRKTWDWGLISLRIWSPNTPFLGPMKRYIRNWIAIGVPVMLASGPNKHPYVLVGYDADGWWVHDSQDSPDLVARTPQARQAGYYRVSDQALGINWAHPLNGYATLVILKKEDAAPRLAISSIPHKGIVFVGPRDDWFVQYRWDPSCAEGYSLVSATTSDGDGRMKTVSAVPGDFRSICIGQEGSASTGILVTNASRTSPASPTLVVRICQQDKVVCEESHALTLAPNSGQYVQMVIPSTRLSSLDATREQECTLKALVTLDGGATVCDQAQFKFKIAPVKAGYVLEDARVIEKGAKRGKESGKSGNSSWEYEGTFDVSDGLVRARQLRITHREAMADRREPDASDELRWTGPPRAFPPGDVEKNLPSWVHRVERKFNTGAQRNAAEPNVYFSAFMKHVADLPDLGDEMVSGLEDGSAPFVRQTKTGGTRTENNSQVDASDERDVFLRNGRWIITDRHKEDRRDPSKWRLVVDYAAQTCSGRVIFRYIYRWVESPPP